MRYEANLAECKKFGVWKSRGEQISRLPHVTPDLIRGHCQIAPNIRMAMWRIEEEGCMPEDFPADMLRFQQLQLAASPETRSEALDELPEDLPVETLSAAEPPADPEAEDAWRRIRFQLQSQMQRGLFHTWVEPLRVGALDREARVLHLVAQNDTGAGWVTGHLGTQIAGYLAVELGGPAAIDLTVA